MAKERRILPCAIKNFNRNKKKCNFYTQYKFIFFNNFPLIFISHLWMWFIGTQLSEFNLDTNIYIRCVLMRNFDFFVEGLQTRFSHLAR